MSWCEGISTCAGAELSTGPGVAASTFAAALQLLVSSQCLLTEPWPPQANLSNGSSVDVIIVGAGSGGSALAARLAETNLTVLLLEAGDDPPIESIVPGFVESLLQKQNRYSWNYTAEDDQNAGQELANHGNRITTARLLGGTGSINRMIYSRSFPADYDEWADIVNDSTWKWHNVLPYFKKTEKMTDKAILNHPPSLPYHGYEGDIQVSSVDEEGFDTIKFLESFEEMGIKIVKDRSYPQVLGAFHQSYTIKNGKRQSSVTAMLNKVAKNDNLFVMKNAFVTKILINDEYRAYGVKVIIGDEELVFYANKEVVSSAGAYNTPKLLMLSGVGPKWHLDELGIKVVRDLPVGSNLQDHSKGNIFIAAESGTCSTDKHFEAIQYLYNRTGPLAIPSRMAVDYVLKGSLTPHIPDFGIFPACLPKGNDFLRSCSRNTDFTQELCSHLNDINQKYDLFRFSVLLRRPKSRGTIRLASVDPYEKPIINLGTFANDEDLKDFPEAYDIVWSLTNTTYFRSKNAFVVDLKLKSCEGLVGPENVKCMVRSLAMTEGHATSSAAMGAVLDSRLRVLGVHGLRVVDASAMPRVSRANTNAAIVMMAEKVADFIKNEHFS